MPTPAGSTFKRRVIISPCDRNSGVERNRIPLGESSPAAYTPRMSWTAIQGGDDDTSTHAAPGLLPDRVDCSSCCRGGQGRGSRLDPLREERPLVRHDDVAGRQGSAGRLACPDSRRRYSHL